MATENENILNQYLSFNLDDEIFAVEVTCVREVLDVPEVTTIPRMPGFMGVINLRSNVVPVIDLRLKFSLAFKSGFKYSEGKN